jgi:hypothetical protein
MRREGRADPGISLGLSLKVEEIFEDGESMMQYPEPKLPPPDPDPLWPPPPNPEPEEPQPDVLDPGVDLQPAY